MNLELSTLTAIPGVLQAVIADEVGRLLDSAGASELPTTAVLVLAHATLAAAAELGRRSGSGDCLEIIQQHENGCIYLHGLPQRRILLVRCQNSDAIPAIRHASRGLISLVETARVQPVAVATLDLDAALHAEPEW